MSEGGKKLRLQSIVRGCSKNTVDTEHVLAQVKDAYDICGEEDCGDGFVDVVLVNTCGFIGDAKEELRGRSTPFLKLPDARRPAGSERLSFSAACLTDMLRSFPV